MGHAHEGGGDAVGELGGHDGEHCRQVCRHADRLARAHRHTAPEERAALVVGDLVQNAARSSAALCIRFNIRLAR